MSASDLYSLDVEEPTALTRMLSDGFEDWSKQAASTGFCSRPVRLFGQARTFDRRSGQHLSTFDSRALPDSVLYVRCGNRRASRCPSCSHEYQGDMWHLLTAGVSGGDKGVPESVSTHPLVFLTLTAPSFGAVHSSTRPGAQPRQCTVNAAPGLCEHGRPRRCTEHHDADDSRIGQALCPDCYDYEGQTVWQWHCPELWRRFTIRLRRLVAAHLGMSEKASRDLLRVQFAKVGEYQKRGAIHLHALVRLDGAPTDGDPFPSPALDLPASWLAERCLEAARDIEVDAPPVDASDTARVLRFGRQADARPVQRHSNDGDDVTPEMVSAYLAKYATKAAGDVANQGTPNRHLRQLRETCLELCGRALLSDGFSSRYALLGKWSDALGFRDTSPASPGGSRPPSARFAMHGASITATANSSRHTQTLHRRTIPSTPTSTSSCSTNSASSDRAGSLQVMPNSPAPPLMQHASGRKPDALHDNPTRKERTMDKLCFTAEEVADRLSVSKTRVYDLMRCGELPSVKLGRSRLIKAADLLAYVENLEPAPVVA